MVTPASQDPLASIENEQPAKSWRLSGLWGAIKIYLLHGDRIADFVCEKLKEGTLDSDTLRWLFVSQIQELETKDLPVSAETIVAQAIYNSRNMRTKAALKKVYDSIHKQVVQQLKTPAEIPATKEPDRIIIPTAATADTPLAPVAETTQKIERTFEVKKIAALIGFECANRNLAEEAVRQAQQLIKNDKVAMGVFEEDGELFVVYSAAGTITCKKIEFVEKKIKLEGEEKLFERLSELAKEIKAIPANKILENREYVIPNVSRENKNIKDRFDHYLAVFGPKAEGSFAFYQQARSPDLYICYIKDGAVKQSALDFSDLSLKSVEDETLIEKLCAQVNLENPKPFKKIDDEYNKMSQMVSAIEQFAKGSDRTGKVYKDSKVAQEAFEKAVSTYKQRANEAFVIWSDKKGHYQGRLYKENREISYTVDLVKEPGKIVLQYEDKESVLDSFKELEQLGFKKSVESVNRAFEQVLQDRINEVIKDPAYDKTIRSASAVRNLSPLLIHTGIDTVYSLHMNENTWLQTFSNLASSLYSGFKGMLGYGSEKFKVPTAGWVVSIVQKDNAEKIKYNITEYDVTVDHASGKYFIKNLEGSPFATIQQAVAKSIEGKQAVTSNQLKEKHDAIKECENLLSHDYRAHSPEEANAALELVDRFNPPQKHYILIEKSTEQAILSNLNGILLDHPVQQRVFSIAWRDTKGTLQIKDIDLTKKPGKLSVDGTPYENLADLVKSITGSERVKLTSSLHKDAENKAIQEEAARRQAALGSARQTRSMTREKPPESRPQTEPPAARVDQPEKPAAGEKAFPNPPKSVKPFDFNDFDPAATYKKDTIYGMLLYAINMNEKDALRDRMKDWPEPVKLDFVLAIRNQAFHKKIANTKTVSAYQEMLEAIVRKPGI